MFLGLLHQISVKKNLLIKISVFIKKSYKLNDLRFFFPTRDSSDEASRRKLTTSVTFQGTVPSRESIETDASTVDSKNV